MILAEPRAFPVGLCWIQGLPYIEWLALKQATSFDPAASYCTGLSW